MFSFCTRQFSEHNIIFAKNLAADLPQVYPVAIRLEQVLMNLIGNVKTRPGKGATFRVLLPASES